MTCGFNRYGIYLAVFIRDNLKSITVYILNIIQVAALCDCRTRCDFFEMSNVPGRISNGIAVAAHR